MKVFFEEPKRPINFNVPKVDGVYSVKLSIAKLICEKNSDTMLSVVNTKNNDWKSFSIMACVLASVNEKAFTKSETENEWTVKETANIVLKNGEITSLTVVTEEEE